MFVCLVVVDCFCFFHVRILGSMHRMFFVFLVDIDVLILLCLVRQVGVRSCVIPFTVLPLVVEIFFSSHATLCVRVVAVLLTSHVISGPVSFMVVRVVTNVITVSSIHRVRSHTRLIHSTLCVLVSCVLVCATLRLSGGVSFTTVSCSVCFIFFVGTLSLLFTCLMVCVVRGLFNFLDDMALIRLSGVGAPLLVRFDRGYPNAFRRILRIDGLSIRITGGVNTGPLLIHAKTVCRSVNGVTGPVLFARGRITNIGPLDALPCRRTTRVVVSRISRNIHVTRGTHVPRRVVRFVSARRNGNGIGCFCGSFGGGCPSHRVSRSLFASPKPLPSARRGIVLVVTSSMRTTSHDLGSCDRRTVGGVIRNIINKRITSNRFHYSPVDFTSIRATGRIFGSGLGGVCRRHVACPALGGPRWAEAIGGGDLVV